MTHQRERIRERVHRHPGEHFNALVRRLDLAPGQVQYHLRKLRRSGEVREEAIYGRTHYYPPDVDDWERGAIALLRRETARDAVLVLLEGGPAAPTDVADALGIARSTLEWHLGHLTECDLVEKRRDDEGRVTLVLARPTATARLLRSVEPSLPERLVDRFDRLLDSLLAE